MTEEQETASFWSCNGSPAFVEDAGPAPEPVVVVGIGMRLPGHIHTASDFWDLLINKEDAVCEVPAERYNVDAFHSPGSLPGSVKTRYGYYLAKSEIFHLDASFFGMTKEEIVHLDPQQRILLEVVHECMQNAGQSSWRGKNIGCFVGSWGADYSDSFVKDRHQIGSIRVNDYGDSSLSNRISKEYDLKGPSMTIKTGSSSSMYALHEAIRAIRAGDCDSALVCGTNLMLSPAMTIAMSEENLLSVSGTCKSFDAAADGYGRGEAINAIFVKKLGDALSNNDNVRVLIRGTALNNDGKQLETLVPSELRQEAVIRLAYKEAHLDPQETPFIECHGTGIAIEDTREALAIANCFGQARPTFLGSAKPNIGHSEGASALTSIIKAILVLEKKQIPPQISFVTPSPEIPWVPANLNVPLEAMEWPAGRCERISVNSFGAGGANAHAILESAAAFTRNPVEPIRGCSSHLLVFSATNTETLQRNMVEHQKYLERYQSNVRDMAYTLANRRETFSHRAFGVTRGTAISFSRPTEVSATPGITFVFNGQGSQWAGMAKELINDFPSFCENIESMNVVLSRLPEAAPCLSIKEELLKPSHDSLVNSPEFYPMLRTAVQIALIDLLEGFGIRPSAVIGHSEGEITAAYSAGAITKEAALAIAFYRGRILKEQQDDDAVSGGMAVVGLSRAEVERFLIEGVAVACENSPCNVTISGDDIAVEETLLRIEEARPATFLEKLNVDRAYHSHHMNELGASYETLLNPYISFKQPSIPMYSTVTGRLITESTPLDSAYWQNNLVKPVLFSPAVTNHLAAQNGQQLFVEIGCDATLGESLQQTFSDLRHEQNASYLEFMDSDDNSTQSVLRLAGELYLRNIPLDVSELAPKGSVLTDLPLYQWRHDEEFRNESRIIQEWKHRPHPRHELLGVRVIEGNDITPTWRNCIRMKDVPWLSDCKLQENVVFPCAAFIGMVGAAMGQFKHSEDITIRNMTFHTKLNLSKTEATEVMTTLRPVHLTTTLTSAWWAFSILSYDGNGWSENCSGQIRSGKENGIQTKEVRKNPRQVISPYTIVQNGGLNYGPAFQGLTHVSAIPQQGIAAGTLAPAEVTPAEAVESPYFVHPIVIEQVFQLSIIARSNGLRRASAKTSLPANISELYLCSDIENLSLTAEATATQHGPFISDVHAKSSRKVILAMQECRYTAAEADLDVTTKDSVAGARLEWKADIELMSLEGLIEPLESNKDALATLETYALLCMIEIRLRTSGIKPATKHLEKFRVWLEKMVKDAEQENYCLVNDTKYWLALDYTERDLALSKFASQVATGEHSASGELLTRILENCQDIFEGRIDTMEALTYADGLTNFYNSMALRTDFSSFMDSISHAKPTLKVLEIGAGAGATTNMILQSLMHKVTKERMYKSYYYTDVSTDSFTLAQQMFQNYPGVEYKLLDISKNPLRQGFEEASFDLVVASNALYSTANLRVTLSNIRKLLHPRGFLFLQEPTPQIKSFNLIMGSLPRWWIGEGDGRVSQPFVGPERWESELKSTGFSGISTCVMDAEPPYHFNANIIARPHKTDESKGRVTLLYDASSDSAHIVELDEFLSSKGFHIDRCALTQRPARGQYIISLLELDAPFVSSLSPADFKPFQNTLKSLDLTTPMLWLTRSSQTSSIDPNYGLSSGLVRSIRLETGAAITMLELEKISYPAIARVFEKVRAQQRSIIDVDPDYEYIFSGGVISIPRYHAVSTAHELAQLTVKDQFLQAEVRKPGLLQTLGWTNRQRNEPGENEVLVKLTRAALNTEDVLIATGEIEGLGLGLEGAGVVQIVGSGVDHVSVGDRVMVTGTNCFATEVLLPSQKCIKIPDTLTVQGAATMPIAFGTALHSLVTVARVQKGQSVLIHSAADGVGLAAVQVCQNVIGAEVYVTVDNEKKAAYMTSEYGIQKDHIFSSQDNSFLYCIKKVTTGRGVDVVLNSLSGDLLQASWKCVAESGIMIEIGQKDISGKAQLPMDMFEGNRTFAGVNISKLSPATWSNLLEKIIQLICSGLIDPIDPQNVFSGAYLEDAFRYMQVNKHIGKILIKIPSPDELPTVPSAGELHLRADRAYLLVGGLGELGRSIASWMVEKGAKNLIILSRSAGQSHTDQEFKLELESQGCAVQMIAGNVCVLEDLQKIVVGATAPIAGVLQMASVFQSKGFLDMDFRSWQEGTSAKVDGTWNLHYSLPVDLDFFVGFSSTSGALGGVGQAAYAAANTFLDAFTRYRQSQGLASSVLDIGLVGTTSPEAKCSHASYHQLNEQDVLDALHWAILHSPAKNETSQLAVGLSLDKATSGSDGAAPWARDARMSVLAMRD